MEFNDSEEADKYISQQLGFLFDNNHKAMQHFRRAVMALQVLKHRNEEIYDNIIQALAASAILIADIHGDIIAEEMGLTKEEEDDGSESD